MNIKMNNYMQQSSYQTMAGKKMQKSYGSDNVNAQGEAGAVTKEDTVSISIEGKKFAAEQRTSAGKMGSASITSDLESFRNAVKSMNEPLTVNWEAAVDPFGTFRASAKLEAVPIKKKVV